MPVTKHITIRNKPLCFCRFSDEQFVKLANLIGGKYQCTFVDNEELAQKTFEAVKAVVRDPSVVELKDGPHANPLHMTELPEELKAKIAQLLTAGPGAPSPNSRFNFPSPNVKPDSDDGEGESGSTTL
jgi:selenocysteine lyase/cysteine desulfurase